MYPKTTELFFFLIKNIWLSLQAFWNFLKLLFPKTTPDHIMSSEFFFLNSVFYFNETKNSKKELEKSRN